VTNIPSDPSVTNRRTWQQTLLLSVLLMRAALLLLVFYGSSLFASLLPLRLFNPAWYLNAADVIMANAPIVITGASLYFIALGIRPADVIYRSDTKLRFQRFCALLSIVYFSVLPLQIVSSVFFVVQFNSAQQSHLQNLQNQQQLIRQRLFSITSVAELNARIAPSPGQSNATLQQRRSEIRATLANEQRQLQRNLRQERQQRLLQLLLSSVRILITALATALFFRLLAQPSDQLLTQAIRTVKHQKLPVVPQPDGET
jgi:hypothetical protein